MKNTLLFIYCIFIQSGIVLAQYSDQTDRAVKATEFAIPSSPAFNMLNDNSPSRIQRFASLHDFKVDWSLYSGQLSQGLNPGLAIEAQPIWLLLFDRKGPEKYSKASAFAQTLSTLSFSIGTNITNDKNWLAWGIKMTVFREDDPMKDPEFIHTMDHLTRGIRDSLLLQINDFDRKKIFLDHRMNDYDAQLNSLEDSIALIEAQINEQEAQQSERVAEIRNQYLKKHWNSSFLDIAFGRLSTYQQIDKDFTKTIENPATGLDTTIAFSTKSLELSNQGWSAWASGGVGIGLNTLISGMVRYGVKPSVLTGAKGNVLSMGLNLRYGNHRYNFFLEGFFDYAENEVLEIPGSKVAQKLYIATVGGDWRISKNVVLCFGIRQTRDFDNKTYLLQPVININCLMR